LAEKYVLCSEKIQKLVSSSFSLVVLIIFYVIFLILILDEVIKIFLKFLTAKFDRKIMQDAPTFDDFGSQKNIANPKDCAQCIKSFLQNTKGALHNVPSFSMCFVESALGTIWVTLKF
jgi:hypothetical protein